jgi:hypothetical protein
MFKVVSPIERNGTTYWPRCGTGFENRDQSINLYIDMIPAAAKDGAIKLQVRELTEEEQRERAEKRATVVGRPSDAAIGSTTPANSVPF